MFPTTPLPAESSEAAWNLEWVEWVRLILGSAQALYAIWTRNGYTLLALFASGSVSMAHLLLEDRRRADAEAEGQGGLIGHWSDRGAGRWQGCHNAASLVNLLHRSWQIKACRSRHFPCVNSEANDGVASHRDVKPPC
nr:hypothetical protein CFP56_34827 [Quercus suber]